MDRFGIELLPNDIDEIYYKDPYTNDKYISLNSYFNYINEATYSELNKVAQDLGAKHIEIYYEIEEKCFVSNSKKATTTKPKKIFKTSTVDEIKLNANFEAKEEKKKFKEITIDGGTDFEGHNNPVKPQLIYLKNEPAIKNLVDMRLDKNNIKTSTLSIQSNNKASINKNTATKIDLALKKMEFEGNASIRSQIEEDNRKHLKYKICF